MYNVALNIGVVLFGIVNDREGACAGQVEGHVVAGLVADPLCAVLDGLELDIGECLVNGVFLGVFSVLALGHGVGFVCAIPCGAEDVGGCACYDADSILCGLGCGLGCGNSGILRLCSNRLCGDLGLNFGAFDSGGKSKIADDLVVDFAIRHKLLLIGILR